MPSTLPGGQVLGLPLRQPVDGPTGAREPVDDELMAPTPDKGTAPAGERRGRQRAGSGGEGAVR
ncbi:hypothetical protein VN1338_45980 [Helicobacter pylori]